ncbi:MAG: peptide deformylase [Alphaproteobacteria bacterium]|nr:peptide deformylase [Alphaproteobacteria bacterium]
MTIRPIIEVPDVRLKTISKPVPAVTDEVRALMDDMIETMHAAHGIGLAAIQIGIPQRIIVMDLSPSQRAKTHAQEKQDEQTNETKTSTDRYDLSGLDHEKPRYFVNPEIIWVSEEKAKFQEGCLSIPEFYDNVERPQECKIKFLDYDGTEQEIICRGILAVCIQHEMDHLEGIVFIDHLSRLKRERILAKLRKRAKLKATDNEE